MLRHSPKNKIKGFINIFTRKEKIMNKPVKVAIQGSCITRDNFNSTFNPEYKKYFDCVLYQHQTSMISLMSCPVDEVNKIDNQINEFQEWSLKTEFSKVFLSSLKEKNPDYLLLDLFADVYFGVIEIGDNQYLTNSRVPLPRTTFYNELSYKKEITMESNKDEFLSIWKSCISRFFEFINKEIPSCKIILTKTHFKNEYLDKSTNQLKKVNETENIFPIDVNLYNTFWDELNSYILDNFYVRCIDLREKEYLVDENHPWGVSYVHYTKDFYQDFFSRLLKIVSDDSKEKEIE